MKEVFVCPVAAAVRKSPKRKGKSKLRIFQHYSGSLEL